MNQSDGGQKIKMLKNMRTNLQLFVLDFFDKCRCVSMCLPNPCYPNIWVPNYSI